MDERTRALEAFAGALDQTIDFWLERLSPADLAAVMAVRLERLGASDTLAQALPEVRVEWAPAQPGQIGWVFGSAAQLEAQLDNIFKLQAICLDMDPGPDVLRDVEIAVRAHGASQGVRLVGRVVHKHKAQVAIQLDKPNLQLRAALDELIHELKHGRATIPAPVPNRPPTPLASSSPAPPPARTVSAPHIAVEQGMGAGRSTLIAAPVHAPARPVSLRDGLIPALVEVAALKVTGLLELKSPAYSLVLTLERGCVQDITRTPVREQDSLERLLVGAGKLSEGQLEQARELAEQYQISVGEALVDLALLEYGEVRVALKTRVLYMTRQLWAGQFKEATLTTLERLPQRSLALPVFLWSLLYRYVLESFTQRSAAELDALREASRGMSIKRVEPLPCDVSQLELGAKHSRLLTVLLDDVRTEQELTSMSQMGRTEVAAVLLTLKALGLTEEYIPDAARQHRTRQLDALTTAQARLGAQNHFEALGLHWSAYDEEIEAAYKNIRAQYDPQSGEFSHISEARDTLAEVSSHLDHAYDELRLRHKRAAYRGQVVDAFKIRSSIEMFEKQIDMAKMRRDIDEAIVYCKRILELQPSNAKAQQDLKLLMTVKERQAASRSRVDTPRDARGVSRSSAERWARRAVCPAQAQRDARRARRVPLPCSA